VPDRAAESPFREQMIGDAPARRLEHRRFTGREWIDDPGLARSRDSGSRHGTPTSRRSWPMRVTKTVTPGAIDNHALLPLHAKLSKRVCLPRE
jgi:hypothetical protein